MNRTTGSRGASAPRRGVALVAVLAAMAVVLLLLGGILRLAVLGRRQLVKELDVRQAESLVEAAVDRAVGRLRVEPGWTGDSERVASEAIVGAGDAEVVTDVRQADAAHAIRVVVDYPAGRPDSIRRERAFVIVLPRPSPASTDPDPATDPAPSTDSPEALP